MLLTPRLTLLPLSREMIDQRLRADTFVLTVYSPEGPLDVQINPEWPGEPLGAFPYFLTQVRDGILPGSFMAVERSSGHAVGMLGTKGKPNAAGEQEIGYGFNPSSWGRGYATEAVEALVAHLLTRPDIQTVTALTALSNRASERVLEKTGFTRTGQNWDKEHGDLTVWGMNRRPKA